MDKTEQREYTRLTNKFGNRVAFTILFAFGAIVAIAFLVFRFACGAV